MAMPVESPEHSSPELQQEGAVPAAQNLNRDQRRQTAAVPRKVPYLSERAGRYYFVRRYPLWMVKQGFFTEPACRVSLRTTDRLEAEREYVFTGSVASGRSTRPT